MSLESLGGTSFYWQDWTPVVNQGASTDIAKTINFSRFLKVGRLCFFNFRLAMTSTGSAGTEFQVTLPFAEYASTNVYVGVGAAVTFNSTNYKANLILRGGSQCVAFIDTDGNGISGLGLVPNAGIVNGTLLLGTVTYETAA